MINLKQLFSHVSSLDPAEVKAYIAENPAGSYTILDVRQSGEYEKAHIPGAKLIPLPELDGRVNELPREKPIFVY